MACASAGLSAASGDNARTPHPPPAAITCLGRIDPDLIRVMPPASSFPVAPPVAEVLVKEGARVTNGQILAVLECKGRLESVWRVAQAQAQVAEQRLARTKGRVRETEIARLRAEMERDEAELELARKDFARSQELHKMGAVAESDHDRCQLLLKAKERASEAAHRQLENAEAVRASDESIAEAELRAAQAQARHAEAEMSQALVRAPMDGLVIKVHAKAGEQPGAEGIMELARTDPIYVTAEVYETDIRHLQTGQRVEVTAPAAPEPFRGVVESLGSKVGRNRVVDNDPASLNDARVVEVKIRLKENPWPCRLIGARVQVRIWR
jgi:HlyD family secretion protein